MNIVEQFIAKEADIILRRWRRQKELKEHGFAISNLKVMICQCCQWSGPKKSVIAGLSILGTFDFRSASTVLTLLAEIALMSHC